MAVSVMPVTHVIFDIDGLLLDTETIYTKMMSNIAEKYGKTFTWDLKVKQMGRTENDSARVFIDELGIPMTVDEYSTQLAELKKIYFPLADLMPGVERLVNHLHAHNIPMSLATGSRTDDYKLKTAQHGEIFNKFSHVVCGSDDPELKKGKPAPDIFLLALERFHNPPTPDKVLVFEDAPNGVESGLAAGMQVVWVPDPQCLKTGDGSTDKVSPTILLKSLVDFKPELFGLPSFDF